MPLAVQRDLELLHAGIAAWLHDRRGVDDPVIERCVRPSDGFSSETVLVDVRGHSDGAAYAESLVVRLPPPGPGIFPEYDLATQGRAQDLASAAGIPTASPTELEADPRWLGAPFLVMPFVAGHIPDQMPIGDAWIMDAAPVEQAAMYDAMLTTLAAIHRISLTSDGVADVPARDLGAELAHWRAYLDWYGDGTVLAPPLHDAHAWCVAHRPDAEPPSALLWGDVRLGNLIFDTQRDCVAVLDWEMASIGAPEHDVAWLLSLEAVQTEMLGQTVPGFPEPAAAIATYEQRLGRTLRDLEWYEIFALVRSTAIMTRIGYLHERAGEPTFFAMDDNPVLGILTRRIEAATGSRR